MKLILNGIETDINCNTAFEANNLLALHGDVIIVNGYQITEDILLHENDILTILKKGVFPEKEQLELMMAARHTPFVHKQVKQGMVAIAGLGGLGSHIAVMLARTGVGHLFLIDYDIVEPSNLNRQNYSIKHLGKLKTDALKEQLSEINPFITIKTKNIKLTQENTSDVLKDYPIVCEAFDSPTSKAMLINTILEYLPNTTVISASGMAGLESANLIQTTHPMKHLYLCGDFTTEAIPGNGLMAPRVQICAGHQANMVIRLLTNQEMI